MSEIAEKYGNPSGMSEGKQMTAVEYLEKAKETAWSDYEYTDGELYSNCFKDGFEFGAKWQAERMYIKQDISEALEILTQHQRWRQGLTNDMPYTPYQLTEALDVAIAELKKLT